MTTVTESSRTKPLLGQCDLRCILSAANRVRQISQVAPRLGRDLTRAERQLLALCGVIVELVVGTLPGVDLDGEPLGDLTLRAQPYVHRRSGGNGH